MEPLEFIIPVSLQKKIHFEPYTEEILLQKIVNMIYRYENQQTVR